MANAVSSSIGRYCHSKNKTLEHTKNQSHIYFNVFLKKKKKNQKLIIDTSIFGWATEEHLFLF